MPVEDVRTWGVIGPENFTGVAVQANKAGCFFFGNGDVSVVDTVRGIDEEEVADTCDRATAHVVLGHAEFRHHVELPNDIGFVFVVVRLLFEWAVVFPVMESFGVEANNFASAGDVPQTVSVDERGAANALIRPIVDSTGGEIGRAHV